MSVSGINVVVGSNRGPPPAPPWHEEHKDKGIAAVIVLLIICLLCMCGYFFYYCCVEVVEEGGPPPVRSKFSGEEASGVGSTALVDLEMNQTSLGDSSDLRHDSAVFDTAVTGRYR